MLKSLVSTQKAAAGSNKYQSSSKSNFRETSAQIRAGAFFLSLLVFSSMISVTVGQGTRYPINDLRKCKDLKSIKCGNCKTVERLSNKTTDAQGVLYTYNHTCFKCTKFDAIMNKSETTKIITSRVELNHSEVSSDLSKACPPDEPEPPKEKKKFGAAIGGTAGAVGCIVLLVVIMIFAPKTKKGKYGRNGRNGRNGRVEDVSPKNDEENKFKPEINLAMLQQNLAAKQAAPSFKYPPGTSQGPVQIPAGFGAAQPFTGQHPGGFGGMQPSPNQVPAGFGQTQPIPGQFPPGFGLSPPQTAPSQLPPGFDQA